jgi:WD40 repeat protein
LSAGLAALVACLVAPAAALAAFPGTNGRLVTTFAWGPSGHQGLATMRPDGSNLVRLSDAAASEAAWSADGRQLAYAGIFTVSAGGGRPMLLTSERGTDPAWSPGGRLLAYAKAESAVAVVDRATGRERVLVRGIRIRDVDWSPDGRTIAYVNDRDLFTVRADGGRPRRLTNEPAERQEGPVLHYEHYVDDIDWSPDGRSIVFTEFVNAPCDGCGTGIWRIRPHGRKRTRLTAGSSHSGPVWSPDGRVITYCLHSMGEPSQRLTMRADGTQLGALEGPCADDWQALPRRRGHGRPREAR